MITLGKIFVFISIIGIFVSVAEPLQARELIIFQISDSHQILEPGTKNTISIARAMTKINEIKAEHPEAEFMIVHSGDFLAPSETSRVFEGLDVLQTLQAFGVEMAAVGNHEFDYTARILLERAKQSEFPFLSANLHHKDGRSLPHIIPYVIKNVGGLRFAFFGVTTKMDTQSVVNKFGDDIVIEDPVASARLVVGEIHRKGLADLVFGLAHLDFHEDRGILEGVPGIDAMFGGHEHELMSVIINGVPLIKVRNDLQDISVTHITISDDPATRVETAKKSIRSDLISLTRDIALDPRIESILNVVRGEVEKQNSRILGELPQAYDGSWAALQNAYQSTSPELGTWVVDLFREGLGGDVGFMNLGIVSRSNAVYGPGPISVGQVNALFPWNDPPVLIEATGAMIRTKLEKMITDAVSEVMQGRAEKSWSKGWSGKFPIVAGLDVRWDWNLPAGSRITRLLYRGLPLADDQVLKLVVNLYIYNSDEELRKAPLLTGPLRTEFEVLTERIKARYQSTGCAEVLVNPKV